MGAISAVDDKTGRKFYLDDPDDLRPGEKLVFLLSLHGEGSVSLAAGLFPGDGLQGQIPPGHRHALRGHQGAGAPLGGRGGR